MAEEGTALDVTERIGEMTLEILRSINVRLSEALIAAASYPGQEQAPRMCSDASGFLWQCCPGLLQEGENSEMH